MRDAIIDNDLRLLAAVNHRIELVSRLREYKRQHDIEFIDPAREEWLHSYMRGANRGPLSDDGLGAIYEQVLELTKRETERGGEAA